MATHRQADGTTLLAGAAARFPAILKSLADAAQSRRQGAIAAAHNVIRRNAARPWTIEIDRQSSEFSIRSAGTRVVLGEPMFGGMLHSVIEQLEAATEPRTVQLYKGLGTPAERRERAIDLLMLLFLAHEFLHIEQQLGSDQYRDSDAYPDAVGAIDYQADVAAISYVAALSPLPDHLGPHALLTFLTTLHLFTMNAFASTMSREAFDRLLVWHFQAARIARASTVPDAFHPAIAQRPTVSLPQFRAVDGEALSEAAFSVRRNDVNVTKLDMVIAAADGSGLLKLFRLAATDDERVRRLAQAIVRKDLLAVREELEEFFLTHGRSMEFTRPDQHTIALQNAVAAGEALLADQTAARTTEDPAVCAFMDNVEFLMSVLPRSRVDPTMATYRADWAPSGWRAPVMTAVNAAALPVAGKQGKLNARRTALTSEIRRITIRLSAILDTMTGDDG